MGTTDFAVDLPNSCDSFAEVYAVDASRLAKVGRLLKATRNVTKAIIPGSMQAIYDLRRGHLRDLWFDADGHQAEITMWNHIRGAIVEGALVLADRYYAKPCIWRQIEAAGAFMLTRHNKVVKHRKIERLSKVRGDSGNVDEWLIDMGGSRHATCATAHVARLGTQFPYDIADQRVGNKRHAGMGCR